MIVEQGKELFSVGMVALKSIQERVDSHQSLTLLRITGVGREILFKVVAVWTLAMLERGMSHGSLPHQPRNDAVTDRRQAR